MLSFSKAVLSCSAEELPMSCWGFCPSWNQTTRWHDRRAAGRTLLQFSSAEGQLSSVTPEPKGKVHNSQEGFTFQQPFLLLEIYDCICVLFCRYFGNKFSVSAFFPRSYFKIPFSLRIWPMPNLTTKRRGWKENATWFTLFYSKKKKSFIKNFQGASTLFIRIPTGAREVSGFKILGSAYVNKRHTSQKLPENKLSFRPSHRPLQVAVQMAGLLTSTTCRSLMLGQEKLETLVISELTWFRTFPVPFSSLAITANCLGFKLNQGNRTGRREQHGAEIRPMSRGKGCWF